MENLHLFGGNFRGFPKLILNLKTKINQRMTKNQG